VIERGFKLAVRRSPALALLAALLLVLAGVTGAWMSERDFREQKVEQARAHAQVLAASVGAALAFEDESEARQAIDALTANPDISAVGVYTETGALFASRSNDGRRPPASLDGMAARGYGGGHARVIAPVTQNQSNFGAVYVELSAGAGAERWMRYIGVALLLVMAGIMVALVAAAQRALSAANEELTRRADALAQSNAQLTSEVTERQKAQSALAQAQKMEAIGQLTGGVAHDFNNLLMVVSSGLRLLETRDDPEKRASIVASMRQAVDRGAGLTKQLLAFSRRQKLTPEVVVIEDRIEGLSALLERSLREDIALKLDFDGTPHAAKIDPGQFELAILNLAVNARDAMPSGGVISIQVRQNRELDGDWIAVSVTDTGVGMSRGVQARAFDPFYTTKEVGKGTGLGLSQVYGFALQSGGRCEIDSTEGRGAIVTLLLPPTDEPVPAKPKLEAKSATNGAGAVLVVEDDDNVASLVCEMINDLGYSATRVPTAHAALERIERGPPVDLVFSDIVMPGGLSGIELAGELRRRKPELPILLTTGYAGRGEEEEVEGFPVLRKPYDRDALGAALASVASH
jgi:signal transduction histidine kinase/CheY-like chemotaxis protein